MSPPPRPRERTGCATIECQSPVPLTPEQVQAVKELEAYMNEVMTTTGPAQMGTIPLTKRRVRKLSVEDGQPHARLRQMWTARVQRGRRCCLCGKHIEVGEMSIRFEDRKSLGKFAARIERAVCKECALPQLKAMVAELETPRDDAMYEKYLKRHKIGETEW